MADGGDRNRSGADSGVFESSPERAFVPPIRTAAHGRKQTERYEA